MTDRPIIMDDHDVRTLLPPSAKRRHTMPIARIETFDGAGQSWICRGDRLKPVLRDAAEFRNVDDDTWCWTAKALPYQNSQRTRWLGHIGFAVGDRLWVRERIRWSPENSNFYYAADDRGVGNDFYEFANGIRALRSWAAQTMPRRASRLTLKVEGVAIRRLKAITRDEALAECFPVTWGDWMGRPPFWAQHSIGKEFGEPGPHLWDNRTTLQNYALGWDAKHGRGAWEANPWVIVIGFSTRQANIDEMKEAA